MPYAFTEQGLAMLSGLLNSGIDMDETLRDQNDINESTRAQLDAISTALAELQAKPSETKTHFKRIMSLRRVEYSQICQTNRSKMQKK